MDSALLGTACGLALACGINAYLPLFALGMMERTGNVTLQPAFAWLHSPLTLGVLLALALVDFIADKVPVLDHLWDLPHTVARPVAAMLCVAAVLDTSSELSRLLLTVLGGGLGGSVHVSKAATRVALGTGGGGLLSLPISIAEDLAVIAVIAVSFLAPKVTLALGVVVLALLLLFAPRLLDIMRLQWNVLRGVARSVLGGAPAGAPETIRERSLFHAPGWVITEATSITGPDDPLRCALRITTHGLRLPRHAWLVTTERRLLVVGRSFTRRVVLTELPLLYVRVASLHRGWLYPTLDLLNLDGQSVRIGFLNADETLLQDIVSSTLSNVPPEAAMSVAEPRQSYRRIG